VALRLRFDSWRWKGVPFYIRAGKSLPVTATEVHVALRHPPAIFSGNTPAHNYVRFRVTPDLVIAIGGQVKESGDEMAGAPVELLASQESDPAELSAYQELLDDPSMGIPHALPVKTMSRRPGGSYSPFSTMPLRCTCTTPAHGVPRRPKSSLRRPAVGEIPARPCGSGIPVRLLFWS
jgi:hypothetical protein